MGKEEYSETTGSTARNAKVTSATVRLYVDLGLIDCIRSADGTRLLKPSAAAEVRAICNKRLASKSRRR